jgi:hypothetical protein
MPSRTKRNTFVHSEPFPILSCKEDIRCRAYELYVARGQGPGQELDDWLQAERELEASVIRLARQHASA